MSLICRYEWSIFLLVSLENSEAQRDVFLAVRVGDFFLGVLNILTSFLAVVFTGVVPVLIIIFKVNEVFPEVLELQRVLPGSHPDRGPVMLERSAVSKESEGVASGPTHDN